MKKTKKRTQCGKGKEKLFSCFCIAPSFAGVLAFFFIPFGIIIFYSVVNNPIAKDFVFLDNFKALIENKAFITAVKNTASFSLIAVPLAVVFSLGLAVILEMNIPAKSLFRTFFLLLYTKAFCFSTLSFQQHTKAGTYFGCTCLCMLRIR